jgi:hypothetical protein
LADTQSELSKVQAKIEELQRKSEEIKAKGPSQVPTDRFLEFEKKAPLGPLEPPQVPDFRGSMYSKRNQYATVYDSGFLPQKNLSGKAEINAKRGLQNAGEAMLTTYQAQEQLRRTPFGQFNAGGAIGGVKSSSVYGGFFKN